MRNLSLQQVMNEVSKRLDALRPEDIPKQHNMMSELEAFATFDPLLSDLQKQYLDLRLTRKKQAQQFGEDSPMAEIAREAEDSAWCMAQTRYIELRRDRKLMNHVQVMMAEQRRNLERQAEEKARKEMHKQAEALSLFYRGQEGSRQQNQNRSPSIFVWLWLFIYIDNFAKRHEISQPALPKKVA